MAQFSLLPIQQLFPVPKLAPWQPPGQLCAPLACQSPVVLQPPPALERPNGCSDVLWRVVLEECGDDCLRGLWSHFGVISALSGGAALPSENHLRSFLRHLGYTYRQAAEAHRGRLQIEARCKEVETAAAAQNRACKGQLLVTTGQLEEQTLTVETLVSQLTQARAQIASLTQLLEESNRRSVDASAHWERQAKDARGQVVWTSVALQDQCQTLQRALADERRERESDLQTARELLVKLETTTGELFQRGRELTATKARAEEQVREAHRNAEFSVTTMEEAARRTLALWQQNTGLEMSKLRSDAESAQRSAALGVSAVEADRSLALVATVWHAASRVEFVAGDTKAREHLIDEVLKAWRLYFYRCGEAEQPLLKPTNAIILEPLRTVAGPRAAEVFAGSGVPDMTRPPPPARNGPAMTPL